jgi:Tol biopolymer transport system component
MQPEPEAPGGESIWIMHRRRGNGRVLYTCPETHCRGLAWHADNRRLVFEQRPLDDNQLPGAPRLRWLDTVTGESAPLFQEEATPGLNARFSPDGNWIAYVTPDQDGVQLYNFENGRHFLARSLTGTPPVWHPDQPLLLISDLNRLETGLGDEDEAEAGPDPHDALAVHLYRVDAVAGERQLLSRPLLVEDGAAAWSPDGAQIAFARRPPRTAAGRQLWLMDAAGGDERVLTGEPLVNYGPPVWSADGRFLLSQRFDLSDPAAEPAIWVIDVVGGDGRQLAANGVFPTWINNE